MTLKDYLMLANEKENTDLAVLIMFLVMEKKVLTFEDEVNMLDFYLQPKFATRMNELLTEYKERMNIQPKPNVYEVETKNVVFYVKANHGNIARDLIKQMSLTPIKIDVLPIDYPMILENNKGEIVKTTIKKLRNRINENSVILGSYNKKEWGIYE
jgi:hypothetical protein